MRITINVPTFKRAGNIETWKFLPGATFWVHDFEVDEYKRAHKGIKIRPIPDKLRGNVARVRNFILDNQPRGITASLQVDDDMTLVGYYHGCKRHFINSQNQLMPFLVKYTRVAKELGVKLWGINVNEDKQCYREYTPFSMLSYISASFSVFMADNDLRYDERFSLKEDYDMTIQQCNKYRRVLRVNRYFYRKKGAEQPGGCAYYRNVEKEMGQIRMLQQKWGRRIVQFDHNPRSHNTRKQKTFDINPVVKIPIRGV